MSDGIISNGKVKHVLDISQYPRNYIENTITLLLYHSKSCVKHTTYNK